MTDNNEGGRQKPAGHTATLRLLSTAAFLSIATASGVLPQAAYAQSYRFTNVAVDGNQRVDASTILSYAGIARGQTISAGQLNDAYQRILGSGLFESVEIAPSGNTLRIAVKEYPTINRISFEGNRRIKDEVLEQVVQSRSRLVFSPTTAERDAAALSEAYANEGRTSARVTPRIIRRSDNRVDLVFEIFEGSVTEISRLGFVGNRAFSDSRLRRVLSTKQAGLLRILIKRDTVVEDRIEFDKQVLRDFYLSRGYVDFRTTSVNAELARERDGYFVTFNVQEGQQFRLGAVTTVSEMPNADADEFGAVMKIKSGQVYSPVDIENAIARMERLAVRKGIDFMRVEPRVTRNDRDLTLDIEFVLSKGPRVFVERIDIEGNATTLDSVVRRQFRIVEGDPFNPREIRESAERVKSLGYFANADVNAREGSSPDKVVVDVNVEEKSTGSLSFGGTFSSNSGLGLVAKFNESNFLGRGQQLSFTIAGTDSDTAYSFAFTEPAFLGRDLRFDISAALTNTDNQFSLYDTEIGSFQTGISFPVSDLSRVRLHYFANVVDMTYDPASNLGSILRAEADQGSKIDSGIGYSFSYDSRRTGLNPNAGVLFEFGQELAGLGGDVQFIRSTAKAVAQTTVFNDEVTLRATIEGGALAFNGSDASRVTDRFLFGQSLMRGFEPDGIGPRQNDGAGVNDALGGNMFAVARFEAEFPLGIPEEYGMRGGAFYDIGNVWGLNDATTAGATGVLYESGSARQVVGLSLFWKTPVGPLRFNWTHALKKEAFDKEQTFDLSISTNF